MKLKALLTVTASPQLSLQIFTELYEQLIFLPPHPQRMHESLWASTPQPRPEPVLLLFRNDRCAMQLRPSGLQFRFVRFFLALPRPIDSTRRSLGSSLTISIQPRYHETKP